jgi:hypothetical protein
MDDRFSDSREGAHDTTSEHDSPTTEAKRRVRLDKRAADAGLNQQITGLRRLQRGRGRFMLPPEAPISTLLLGEMRGRLRSWTCEVAEIAAKETAKLANDEARGGFKKDLKERQALFSRAATTLKNFRRFYSTGRPHSFSEERTAKWSLGWRKQWRELLGTLPQPQGRLVFAPADESARQVTTSSLLTQLRPPRIPFGTFYTAEQWDARCEPSDISPPLAAEPAPEGLSEVFEPPEPTTPYWSVPLPEMLIGLYSLRRARDPVSTPVDPAIFRSMRMPTGPIPWPTFVDPHERTWVHAEAENWSRAADEWLRAKRAKEAIEAEREAQRALQADEERRAKAAERKQKYRDTNRTTPKRPKKVKLTPRHANSRSPLGHENDHK